MSDQRYSPSRNVVTRSIAGETILVPIVNETGDMESIYGLNELGECIWKLIDGRRSVNEVIQAIGDSYEVDPEVAKRDVIDFVQVLKEHGLIETAEGAGN